MCGRFTLWVDLDQLAAAFPWMELPSGLETLPPRYNIAPTQPVAVVPNDGSNRLNFFVWGLVPSWAKDPSVGNRMINARAETLGEKPSFRSAYRRRRCLVLADGFYEWQQGRGKIKTPHYIRLRSGEPFALAGLWEEWHSPEGDQLLTCTIITTEPNELVAQYHNRMPVILPESTYERWLDPSERQPDELDDLLGPYPAAEMEGFAVSTLVNSPGNDDPSCIEPVQEEGTLF